MKVFVFGKSKEPRGDRPVEVINFNKIYSSKESETNGKSTGRWSLNSLNKLKIETETEESTPKKNLV